MCVCVCDRLVSDFSYFFSVCVNLCLEIFLFIYILYIYIYNIYIYIYPYVYFHLCVRVCAIHILFNFGLNSSITFFPLFKVACSLIYWHYFKFTSTTSV